MGEIIEQQNANIPLDRSQFIKEIQTEVVDKFNENLVSLQQEVSFIRNNETQFIQNLE